jgi:cytochrome c oxidase subunit IV
MAEHSELHSSGYKTYVITWGWLLVLTALALGVGYTHTPEGLKAFLLVCATLAKVLVIVAMFMHLRYERLNLILITFVPLVLAIVLFSFTFPDAMGNANHVIRVR